MDFKNWLENYDYKANQIWVPGNPLTDKAGNPIVLYHGTDRQFNRFSLKKSTLGIIWMTNDLDSIKQGKSGAAGKGRIISMYVSLMNPAGWEEYEKLMLGQLKRECYDGAILANHDATFDCFVFSPSQIKILSNHIIS